MTLSSLILTAGLDGFRLHRIVSVSHRTRAERIVLATHYLRACALIFAPIAALSAQSPPTATIDGRLLRPGVDTFYMVSNIRGHADTAKPVSRSRVSMFYPFPAPFRIVSSDFATIGTDTLPGRTGHPETCWVIKIVLPEGFTRFWVSMSNHDLLRTVSGEGATSVMFVR
jgi:hypothetical protein